LRLPALNGDAWRFEARLSRHGFPDLSAKLGLVARLQVRAAICRKRLEPQEAGPKVFGDNISHRAVITGA